MTRFQNSYKCSVHKGCTVEFVYCWGTVVRGMVSSMIILVSMS